MAPIVYLGIGLLGFVFLSRKTQAATLRPLPSPVPTGAVETQVTVPLPAGWRRVYQAEVTPALSEQAATILGTYGGQPYGTFVPIDGTYAAIIEQHYHEPGGPMKPWGFHHGVTLLTRTT